MDALKETLWRQFGASIDMLRNAIMRCPDDYWNNHQRLFYTAYHCILFLDYYLTIPPNHFSPELPFTLTAPDQIPADAVDDLVPDRIYSRQELVDYLQHCRAKCHHLIDGFTERNMHQPWIEKPDLLAPSAALKFSVLEILLYNMRHVQHHAAQLNLLLRQGIDVAPVWVSQAEPW